jgi:DNA-binding CsgD family transcriptional regulator
LEANKIKEEYLGYYFSIDTEFMTRMEKLLYTIERKLVDRKWDEIKLMLKTVDFKKEKDDLLTNFDKTFIKLFPDFVDQFNTLFSPEDRFVLKKDQLLNTELRIFALIRMGITDNEKIAEILNYSINTIYSYKTKMRNKAIIPKDDFDKKITEITTLSYQNDDSKNNESSI